ncbi:MAG: hypothetical protein U1F10_03440 [Burkholderiales bacterium]
MRRWLSALALALCVPLALAADTGTGASGTFKSKDIDMKVASAMAFKGTSLMDKDPVIVVAIANARVKPAVLADYYDRRLAFDKRIKDEDTGVVYFEFGLDGKYQALSYYFGSGNGCAYCSGGVASTVKLAGGKLVGNLKSKEANPSFDVNLDVPVTGDDHGAALPADGGEPGRAYLAYHAALTKRDAKAVRPLLSNESAATFDRAAKDGRTSDYLQFLAEDHPTKGVRVVRGFATADKAVLLITGDAESFKLKGEVLLAKEGGTWRVVDELTEMVVQ